VNTLKAYAHRAASFLRLKRMTRRSQKAALNGLAELSFGPSSLNLMMADTCNSQCIMCGHDYKARGTGERLTLQAMRTIYGHLNMAEVVDVIYGGGGEPFLNPELADIAEFTREIDPVIQHTVITNAIHGDAETYRRLLRSRVHFLCSINAATPETFEAVSGTGHFHRALDHLRMLVALRKEVSAPVDISISMVLMRRNIDELCDFIRMARREGADGVKTLYVRLYPDAYRHRSNTSCRITSEDSLFFQQEHSDRVVREAAALAGRLNLSFDHEPFFADSTSRSRDCIDPWKSLFINFNGDAYPCPASEILFMNKINSRQYASGNILEQPIMEFWNNPFWQALRKTNSVRGRQEIVPECLCCGNAMCWNGVRDRSAHLLDWSPAEQSDLRL